MSIDAASLVSQFMARYSAAETTLASAVTDSNMAARAARVPRFRGALLAGYIEDAAFDVAAAVQCATQTTDMATTRQYILSACTAAFTRQTSAVASSIVTIPARAGLAVVDAHRAALPTADASYAVPFTQAIPGKTVDLKDYLITDGTDPSVTERDAAGMLALAVYAAGKDITDDNLPGFLGSGKTDETKGRAGAIMDSLQVGELYIKGDRGLTKQSLIQIRRSFAADPAARMALFMMVDAMAPAPANIYEQAVAAQGRLLRSEGRGSYERAILTLKSFADILIIIPAYKAEMETLLTVTTTLARETSVIRNYGYIIYQDAYEVLRVSQFPRLATMGAMIVAAASKSGRNIRTPLSGTARDEVEEIFTVLSQMARAKMDWAIAQAKKLAKEAADAASA